MHSTYLLLVISFIASFSFSNGEAPLAPEDKPTIDIITPPPPKCERKSKVGDLLYFHHIGKLLSTGVEFDNTHKHHNNEPLATKLGAGLVIDGWEKGLVDMCVGEKRKLTIPPSLGYGEKGHEEMIPANATIISEIELVDIKDDDGTFMNKISEHFNEEDAGHHIQASPMEFTIMDENDDKHIDKDELTKYITKKNEEAKEEDKIKDVSKVVDDMMKDHDRDSDGKLSFEENQHMFEHLDENDVDPYEYDYDHAFEDMDADKDQHVSIQEMKDYFIKHNQKSEKDKKVADIDKAVKDYFETHDLDKDGKLSPEENMHQPGHGGEL